MVKRENTSLHINNYKFEYNFFYQVIKLFVFAENFDCIKYIMKHNNSFDLNTIVCIVSVFIFVMYLHIFIICFGPFDFLHVRVKIIK